MAVGAGAGGTVKHIAPGIVVAHNRFWHLLYRYLTSFGNNRGFHDFLLQPFSRDCPQYSALRIPHSELVMLFQGHGNRADRR